MLTLVAVYYLGGIWGLITLTLVAETLSDICHIVHPTVRHLVTQIAEKPLSRISWYNLAHNLCTVNVVFVYPNWYLLALLTPGTSGIFRNYLSRPTKFWTNLLLNHFKFGKITKLPVLIWSGVRCFTVYYYNNIMLLCVCTIFLPTAMIK